MADVSRLPGPNSDVWDWQLLGSCRGEDPSLFFHPEGERGPTREARITAAKEICSSCPVQLQCNCCHRGHHDLIAIVVALHSGGRACSLHYVLRVHYELVFHPILQTFFPRDPCLHHVFALGRKDYCVELGVVSRRIGNQLHVLVEAQAV